MNELRTAQTKAREAHALTRALNEKSTACVRSSAAGGWMAAR